ncbi:uncharacterized protein LOC111391100 [Olea europaea var. sylvestris]|uniref:uncharacterized protein LOC111391100 n=1 Tax=Olea europaea var. sylvestris TaxID=158386 RepID=UPI000C1D5B29|nr:uncharacterized protein LOC111391100 [Olea europaea var. sylvestris]
MCKAFLQTLTNVARDWFSTLEPNSISSFANLADKFLPSLPVASASERWRPPSCNAAKAKMRLSVTSWFNNERLQIPDLHITVAISTLTHAIRCEAFKMSLSKTPSKLVIELLTREAPRNKQRQETPPSSFTKLNTSRANKLMEIKDMKEFKWPPRMKSPSDARDRSKYCDFHKDHGHTTENCMAFKREIEALIKRGLLGSYVSNDKRLINDHDKEKSPKTKCDHQPMAGTINIIVGGIASGGNSNNGRKQYSRQRCSTSGMHQDRLEDITFGGKDLDGVSLLHDDALVISAIIANFEVRRILTDNGSAANILSYKAFGKMGISTQQLKLAPVKQDQGNRVHFSPWQEIPYRSQVGVVREDQVAAKQCYITSLREISTDVMQLSDTEPDPDHRMRLSPVEELVEVEKKVNIDCVLMKSLQRNSLLAYLETSTSLHGK